MPTNGKNMISSAAIGRNMNTPAVRMHVATERDSLHMKVIHRTFLAALDFPIFSNRFLEEERAVVPEDGLRILILKGRPMISPGKFLFHFTRHIMEPNALLICKA